MKKKIYKAEIHVHLEATITPALCRKFAKRNQLEISEEIFGNDYTYAWDDFYDFIKKYDIVTSLITTPEDYYDLTYNYLKDCAKDDVLYVEAMVSSTHAKMKGMTYHSFMEGVTAAAKKAEKDFGIVSRYIMNGIRHLGPESVHKTAIEVLKNPHPYLVGFGLAGDELHFPPKLFVKTFDMLKKENFPITVHAGEWDGPEKIKDAIHLLHPTRLGHGVRCIEDINLVNEIRDLDIVLETCPTSNIATKIYPNYREHPIRELFDKGLKVTVNSDDPPFFNASIGGEYDAMSQIGFTDNELLTLTKNAITYSFCDNEAKNNMLKKID
ncbi:MAG: adenosine deaminase [Pelagibacteraceae bacterium]|nr:adenosine deaminase [Pelagibacteraceae bacterium]